MNNSEENKSEIPMKELCCSGGDIIVWIIIRQHQILFVFWDQNRNKGFFIKHSHDRILRHEILYSVQDKSPLQDILFSASDGWFLINFKDYPDQLSWLLIM